MFCPIANTECKRECMFRLGNACLVRELPEALEKISSSCSAQTRAVEDIKTAIIRYIEEQEKINYYLKRITNKE